MTFRRFATAAALGIAGLAAAVGIGVLANSISGDSVGLGAEPLAAGDALAPATAKAADKVKQRKARNRKRNRGTAQKEATPPADSVAVPPSTGTGGTVTTFDDHGGSSGGSGSDDGSSTSSGSGSSGTSGSSGSRASGSGSSSHSGGSDD